ncbi:MAG: DEAD/DEAH box helicase [Acidimicrobiales bacterium]
MPAPPPPSELYRWQLDALTAWLRCGRRGVIEAVTGSGKTDVALAAAADARRRGRFVLVVAPSRVLMEQWHGRLRAALPGARIGRLGDAYRDTPEGCDVLISTRHSAASHRPAPPEGAAGGLLVADECHGFGGAVLRRALLAGYEERLGLTATLERSDDAVEELLLPYFGGVCWRYGFAEAIADGVCARPRAAFVGVALSRHERQEYLAVEAQLVAARRRLRSLPGMPLSPFGAFLAGVGRLAELDAGPDGRAARDYLDAFAKRRHIVAQSSAKHEVLGRFAGLIERAEGALVFTETVRAANHAINRLDPHVGIELITGATARQDRKDILEDLRAGRLDAVAAPRVLDEGVDVPDANLGIVVSASRTRRQMIQRMGRVLRRKRPGVSARFVVLFARDTLEDPALRGERDGFVEEIEQISEAAAVFDASCFAEIEAFLDAPGPADPPAPERLAAVAAQAAAAQAEAAGAGADAWEAALVERLGVEGAYAYLAYALGEPDCRAAAVLDRLGARLPPPGDGPYLAPPELELPAITTPRAAPKRLSTGDAPLEVVGDGSVWRLTCTGCGAASPPTRYRWQALDQTVACTCS